MKKVQETTLPPTKIAASLVRQVCYERPEGYFTTAEYAKDNGVSRSAAATAIRRLHDHGNIAPVRFKIQRNDGQWQMAGGWMLVNRNTNTPPPIDKPARKR